MIDGEPVRKPVRHRLQLLFQLPPRDLVDDLQQRPPVRLEAATLFELLLQQRVEMFLDLLDQSFALERLITDRHRRWQSGLRRLGHPPIPRRVTPLRQFLAAVCAWR